MSNDLYLTSPIPVSINHYIAYRAINKNGRPMAVSYKTKEAVVFQESLESYVRSEVVKQDWTIPVDNVQHFYVDADFYFPRIDMDANNYWKILLDAITNSQCIWKDDNVVCERVNRVQYDASNPRIELHIHPVDYIGVFDNASQLERFIGANCIGCTRYTRNCKLLDDSKKGKIHKEVSTTNMTCDSMKTRNEKEN